MKRNHAEKRFRSKLEFKKKILVIFFLFCCDLPLINKVSVWSRYSLVLMSRSRSRLVPSWYYTTTTTQSSLQLTWWTHTDGGGSWRKTPSHTHSVQCALTCLLLLIVKKSWNAGEKRERREQTLEQVKQLRDRSPLKKTSKTKTLPTCDHRARSFAHAVHMHSPTLGSASPAADSRRGQASFLMKRAEVRLSFDCLERSAEERLMLALPAHQGAILMSACESDDCNNEAMGGNFHRGNNDMKRMV